MKVTTLHHQISMDRRCDGHTYDQVDKRQHLPNFEIEFFSKSISLPEVQSIFCIEIFFYFSSLSYFKRLYSLMSDRFGNFYFDVFRDGKPNGYIFLFIRLRFVNEFFHFNVKRACIKCRLLS